MVNSLSLWCNSCLFHRKKPNFDLMKRIIPATLLLFILALIAAPSSGQNTDAYSIKVKIDGYSQDKVYLVNYYADKEYLKDSAVRDRKGWFHFKGPEALGCGIYSLVNTERNAKLFELMVDSKDQTFTMETDSAKSIENMKVKGSEENEKFFGFQQKTIDMNRMRAEMIQEYREVSTRNQDSANLLRDQIIKLEDELKEARNVYIDENPGLLSARVFKATKDVVLPDHIQNAKNEDGTRDSMLQFHWYRDHYWDNFDFTEDCLIRTPVFHNKLHRYIQKMTVQIPDSINAAADKIIELAKDAPEVYHYTVWWITMTYERSEFMCMDAVPVHMWNNYYGFGKSFWLDSADIIRIEERAKVLSRLVCGIKTPNLIMKDSSHRYQNLYKTNPDGKYTVLLFWDPDCSHCKKEMPKIKRMYDSLKHMGVEIYAVGVEQEYEKWKEFIRKNDLDWINVIDVENRTNFRYMYDIKSTPIIYLLDEDKKIIAKKMGAEQLEKILRDQLGLLPLEKDDKDEKPAP